MLIIFQNIDLVNKFIKIVSQNELGFANLQQMLFELLNKKSELFITCLKKEKQLKIVLL